MILGGLLSICNVYTLHQAVTPPEQVQQIDQDCRSGKLPCGECKRVLIGNLLAELDPIRGRAEELRAEPKRVLQVLQSGAERARCIARETMVQVRDAMGVGARLPKP